MALAPDQHKRARATIAAPRGASLGSGATQSR